MTSVTSKIAVVGRRVFRLVKNSAKLKIGRKHQLVLIEIGSSFKNSLY
jgi:hypothetical protein